MQGYQEAYESFDLSRALATMARPPDEGNNAAIECCDRWCGENRVALHWADATGAKGNLTFEELRDRSARLANLFVEWGIEPGDRIAALLPRTPELIVVILAAWRAGAVYQPLFTAFGPKAIEHRLKVSRARLIVTDDVHRDKLRGVESEARVVRVVPSAGSDDLDLSGLAQASPVFEAVLRSLDDPFLMMFTSGTTGAAKGLYVPLRAVPSFRGYMLDCVGLQEGDQFWNIADPGWAYGLYYAIIGPLSLGHATLLYNGPFAVAEMVRVIKGNGITNLAGSPTAFRLVIAAGAEAVSEIKGQLRAVSSAGEPLNPEIARWFAEHLEAPILDHYGQTELGMVVCSHHALSHHKARGSAGLPVPGHRVAVLNEKGAELEPGTSGILSVDLARSPLCWFRGYAEQPTEAIQDGFYRTGDVAELNEDGSISFVGRSDDVITSSGYRIGPFEVESALVEHDAVTEAAVIGKPDLKRTEIVKAFIILAEGWSPGEELSEELRQHVRARLAAHAYPREIAYVSDLPKTPSGKIQRFLLRQDEIVRMQGDR